MLIRHDTNFSISDDDSVQASEYLHTIIALSEESRVIGLEGAFTGVLCGLMWSIYRRST